MITQERLKDLLSYDPISGYFTWIVTRGCRKAGSIAGGLGSNEYHYIRIDRITYLTHRLVWLYVYGEWPKDEIDHINHDRGDNRISNLRHINRYENQKNRPMQENNTSGVVGVCWDKDREKWRSNIKVNRKNIYIGRYDEMADAVEARKDAEKKYKFHENHGA
jgi:hypothetical protein